MIKEFLQPLNGSPTETEIKLLGKYLLPKEEVMFWIEHLETVSRNRKRCAAKAAATRRAKKQSVAAVGSAGKNLLKRQKKSNTGSSVIIV